MRYKTFKNAFIEAGLEFPANMSFTQFWRFCNETDNQMKPTKRDLDNFIKMTNEEISRSCRQMLDDDLNFR